jgi:hypothetical protein
MAHQCPVQSQEQSPAGWLVLFQGWVVAESGAQPKEEICNPGRGKLEDSSLTLAQGLARISSPPNISRDLKTKRKK